MKCDNGSADPDAQAKIFRRIKNSREYRNAESGLEPKQLFSPFGLYLLAFVQTSICIAIVGMAIYSAWTEEWSWTLIAVLLPIIGGLLGLFGYALATSVRTIRAYRKSPAIAIPVIVISKRTSGRRSTFYHVTIEYEDGSQEEIDIWDVTLFQQMKVNDAGALIRRGPIAVGFLGVAA